MMRIYLPTIFAGAMALLANNASAASQNVQALANFRVVLTLGSTQNIDFNNAGGDDIEFTGTAANTDVLTLATDGDLTEVGTFFVLPVATGIPGEVDITGSVGEIVDISCDTTATMTDDDGDEIILSAITFSTDAGTTEATCDGVGTTPEAYTLLGTVADQILLGGSIVADSGDDVTVGEYSTAKGTPDPIVVQVVYQ